MKFELIRFLKEVFSCDPAKIFVYLEDVYHPEMPHNRKIYFCMGVTFGVYFVS